MSESVKRKINLLVHMAQDCIQKEKELSREFDEKSTVFADAVRTMTQSVYKLLKFDEVPYGGGFKGEPLDGAMVYFDSLFNLVLDGKLDVWVLVEFRKEYTKLSDESSHGALTYHDFHNRRLKLEETYKINWM